MHKLAKLRHLKAVDDEVDDRLPAAGVTARCLHARHTRFKDGGQLVADLIRLDGDDHRAFGAVEAVHDKVHRFKCRHVGNNGIERQDPAFQQRTADEVKHHIICHHERAHGDTDAFGEDDRHDLDTVHRTAEADRKAAARTGDQPAEECAKQQIRPRERRGQRHIER